jgi:hypothetical protein
LTRDPNRERLIRVAERLGELLPKVAFVGGSVTGLLVSNIDIRPTDDVDLIAPGESPTDYELDVARPLRELGWREDASDRAPRCRWVHPDAGLADVMTPVDAGFGFSNRWYPRALATAMPLELKPGLVIRVLTVPYYLATKTEAFLGRGEGDFQASHDIEDIVTVVAATEDVVEQVARADEELRTFLSGTLAEWAQTNGQLPMPLGSRLGAPGPLVRHTLGHLAQTEDRRELATAVLIRFRGMALDER